eukprot:2697813-Rhodomonas_salina.4
MPGSNCRGSTWQALRNQSGFERQGETTSTISSCLLISTTHSWRASPCRPLRNSKLPFSHAFKGQTRAKSTSTWVVNLFRRESSLSGGEAPADTTLPLKCRRAV